MHNILHERQLYILLVGVCSVPPVYFICWFFLIYKEHYCLEFKLVLLFLRTSKYHLLQFDQLLLLPRDKGNWNHPMLTSQPSCTYRKILVEIEFSIRKWGRGGGGETIILCARMTYLDPRVRDITKLALIIYLPFVKTVQWNSGFWNWWSSFVDGILRIPERAIF